MTKLGKIARIVWNLPEILDRFYMDKGYLRDELKSIRAAINENHLEHVRVIEDLDRIAGEYEAYNRNALVVGESLSKVEQMLDNFSQAQARGLAQMSPGEMIRTAEAMTQEAVQTAYVVEEKIKILEAALAPLRAKRSMVEGSTAVGRNEIAGKATALAAFDTEISRIETQIRQFRGDFSRDGENQDGSGSEVAIP